MLESFHRDGFAKIDRLFSPKEIGSIRAAFEKLLREPPDGVGVIREDGSQIIRSVMGWQRAGGLLKKFAFDERILRLIRPLIGQPEIHQTKWNPKSPQKGEKWDPHRGDTFWCIKDGIPDPNGIVSVFVAMTEQTEQSGAVYAWRGSQAITLEEVRWMMTGLDSRAASTADTSANLSVQLSTEALAHFDQRFDRVPLTGTPGSVWVVHSGLLHASGRNESTDVRELVANVYRDETNKPKHPRQPEYLCEKVQN